MRLAGSLSALAVVSALALAPTAQATFPGPNGKIAFQSYSGGGIYTIDPDGSDLREISGGGFEPAWSPDGSWLAYSVGDGLRLVKFKPSGNVKLKPQGKKKKKRPVTRTILTDGVTEWEPAWSPDGSRIAFRRGGARNAYDGDLHIVARDGTGLQLIASPGAQPAWSVASATAPAGTIVYSAPGGPCAGGIHLFSVNPDGSGQSPLTFGCTSVAFNPSWNPQGSALAFAAYIGGADRTEIFTGDPAGTSRTAVTDLPGYDFTPAWSPQSDLIVFENQEVSGSFLRSTGLYLVDPANPFNESLIPNTAGVGGSAPDWRPR